MLLRSPRCSTACFTTHTSSSAVLEATAPNYNPTCPNDVGRATRARSWSDWPDLTCPRLAGFDVSPEGLRAEEVDDVLFTNAALCLPARRNDKHPLSVKQVDACKPWLGPLTEDAAVTVVVTVGATAL